MHALRDSETRPENSTSRPLRVEEVTTETGFDALQTQWDRLVAQLEVPTPFNSWQWCRLWWRHFGGGKQLRIVVIRDGTELAGIAPLYERRAGRAIGVRVLEPIGWEDAGLQGLTEGLDLIFPEPDRGELLDVLCAWLQGGRWTAAWLPSLRDAERLPSWLEHRVVRAAAPVPFHYRALPSSWELLVAGLNKSMRDNVKYYPRLLEREGHRRSFTVAETAEAVSAALPVLFELHQLRAQAPTSVRHWNHFRRESRQAFVRELVPLLAGSGQLKIGLLQVDGETVAAQMWLERGDTVFMYYSGYLPSWARHSVALVATLETLKYAIAHGSRRVEFLRGGGQLKERWDGQVRVRRHVMVARHPTLVRSLLPLAGIRRRLPRSDRPRPVAVV